MDAQRRGVRGVADVVQLAAPDDTRRARAQVDNRAPTLREHLAQLTAHDDERTRSLAVVVHADVLARRPPEKPRLVEVCPQEPYVMAASVVDAGVRLPHVAGSDLVGDRRYLI